MRRPSAGRTAPAMAVKPPGQVERPDRAADAAIGTAALGQTPAHNAPPGPPGRPTRRHGGEPVTLLMPSSRALHLFDAALAIWVAAWIVLGVAIGVNVGRLTALSETVAQDGQA